MNRPYFRLLFEPSQYRHLRYYQGKLLLNSYKTALAYLNHQIALPHDVPVYAFDCGMINTAFVSSDESKHIEMCYEMVEAIAQLHVRRMTGLDFDTRWSQALERSADPSLAGVWREDLGLGVWAQGAEWT
ncbi:MAG: DUF4344 domain-containing metallopeptidase [Pseudomonadota bacterium]